MKTNGFIKRLMKVIGFIPILLVTFPIEAIFYGMRWVITGKEFPDSPIIHEFIFEW